MPTLELHRSRRCWHLPVIAGQWRREGDAIIAEYDDARLFWALCCVLPEAALLRLVTEVRRAGRLQAEAREIVEGREDVCSLRR